MDGNAEGRAAWFYRLAHQVFRLLHNWPPLKSVEVDGSLSAGKGRTVLYRDFVTILWGASMEYVTKLATQQSQKPQSLPPNYNVVYPIDAPMRPVKISPVLKILLTGSWAECKVLVNIYLYCQAGPDGKRLLYNWPPDGGDAGCQVLQAGQPGLTAVI